MIKCPAEIVLQIAKFCEARRDISALAATCRQVHGHLEAHLYRCRYQAASLDERDHEVAIFQVSYDVARLSTLRKWINYIPNDGKTDTSRRDWFLGAALRTAASAGNELAVMLLLDHGAPKDVQNFEDQTAFMCSLIAGHVGVAKLLIGAGCDMSLGTEFDSPLHVACRLGDSAIEVVEMMLNRGINPYNTSDMYWSSAPGEAAGAGSLGLLRLFVARGVDLFSDVHYRTWTLPASAATIKRQYEALEFLLQGGLLPPWHTQSGQALLATVCRWATVASMRLFFKYTGLTTRSLICQPFPLLILVIESNVNQDLLHLVRLLISQGADVNCCDAGGRPALAYAISRYRSDRTELLDMLINAGADVSRSFCLVRTAIRGSSTACLARLIEAGVDLSARGSLGTTPLVLASAIPDGSELVSMIVRHQADDIDAKDDSGETALQCAICCGHAESAQQLLDHGADANQFTKEATSLLSFTVIHNDFDSLLYLLDAGADVNALDRDPTGFTPLMHAVVRKNSHAAGTLIQHGASREVRDKTGRGLKELRLECGFTD